MFQFWYVGIVCRFGVGFDGDVFGMGLFGIFFVGKCKVYIMSEQEIQDCIDVFVQVVVDVEVLGFDGIELYGVYGYFIDQFFWKVMNECSDCWGGLFENCL